jgi:protein O-GlcNAc transferase
MNTANLQRAVFLHQQGMLNEAFDAYQRLLKGHSRDVNVLNLLGVLCFQQGRHQDGVKYLKKCLQIKPDFVQAHNNLGNGLSAAGLLKDAIQSLKRAVALDPSYAEAHHGLGGAYCKQNDFESALRHAVLATEINPGLLPAWVNRGIVLHALGRYDEALKSYDKALKLTPGYAAALLNKGRALKKLDCVDEAVHCYRSAVAGFSQDSSFLCEFGELLVGINRPDEALPYVERALELAVEPSDVLVVLGECHEQLREEADAERCYRQAVTLQPRSVGAHVRLGLFLRGQLRLVEAEQLFLRVLEIDPDNVDAQHYLSVVFADMNRIDEYLACHKKVLDAEPEYLSAISIELFYSNYSSNLASDLLCTRAKYFGSVAAKKTAQRFHDWHVDLQPQRLKVGLVSGDLREHAVSYFLEDLLAHLDQNRIEIIAYPAHRFVDDRSLRIMPRFSAWKPLAAKSDKAASDLIRNDGVHILLDLSGHTAHNRLPMFSAKPAPVQASWLGYCATSGLNEMDYYIADAHTLPEPIEGQFVEKIWRLPESYLCFSKPKIDVSVSDLPAKTNRYITFGSFNNLLKVTSEVMALWSRILIAVPNSKLFLKAKQLNEAEVRTKLIEQFASYGISADRLVVSAPIADQAAHYQAYGQVDIALDTFPYNGVTTTVEALWMGVPVLAVAGDRFLSRQGVGLLTNVGLAEWIAVDAEELVVKAVAYSSDFQKLAVLRAGLRERVEESPIFDAARFARNFEDALWGMWRQWRIDNASGLTPFLDS